MLIEKIGTPAMLEQTAEECTELAQACLKLSRYYRCENPTHKSKDEILTNMYEEIADVEICISELLSKFPRTSVDSWKDFKKHQIEKRITNMSEND